MENVKPSSWLLMGGGAVLFIASLLDWVDINFGSKTEWFGIQWIFTLLIGGGIAVAVGLRNFGNVELPDNILGFDRAQLHMMLSFAAFLITFGQQFGESRAIGVLLGWIAAAVMCVGAFMEMKEGAAEGAAPTQF